MTLRLGLLMGAILVSVLQGCRSRNEEPLQSSYFPLAVGNRWVYESSESTAAAPVLESWEVFRQQGENAFSVRIKQPYAASTNLEEMFVTTTEGIKHLGGQGRVDAEFASAAPRLFLKLPPEAGATWQNEDGRYAITAIDETVTVPAGTFTDCVEVTYWTADGKATVTSSYAPGVGMVQREERFSILGGIGNFDTPPEGRAVLQLKEWTIKSSEIGVRSSESATTPQGQGAGVWSAKPEFIFPK